MASRPARARSSASTLTMSRPMSAQSTHSTDSNATQPIATAPSMGPQQHPLVPPTAWQHPQHMHQQPIPGPSATDALNSYTMDASLAQFNQVPLSFAQASFQYNRMQSPAPSSVEGEGMGGIELNDGEAPKKKASATSLANDMELRRLFRENDGRSLPEVAGEVRKEEKGPKAEKSKQVFGMLWLSQNIKKSSQSVPRNRVYTSYATRCADDHLPLLNPASFGKLVRIIFPNVQTRRLGVRGESKYHYVNLSLINDDGRGSVPPTGMTIKTEPARTRTLSIQPPVTASVDKAFFPNLGSPVRAVQQRTTTTESLDNSMYLQRSYATGDRISIPSSKDIMHRRLCWPNTVPPIPATEQLELPSIEPYLPAGTDPDAANSLVAVYRSHCVHTIDNFRYCKTDAFCDSFKSLLGLLTVPSQKLLAHPQLGAWIEAVDTQKYRRMVPLLRNIILASVPASAMEHMERVAHGLCSWISSFFSNQPQHVFDAMLRPASTFVAILSRFIRVNRTAHDVSRIFASEDLRDELWTDWVKGSQPLQIVEATCAPVVNGGHHRLLYILFQESKFLVQPTNAVLERTSVGLWSDMPWVGRHPRGFIEFRAREVEQYENATQLERLVRWIEDLPNRFPGITAREFLKEVDVAVGVAHRNMALNQTGHGMGHWWTISLFISEMLYWNAEVGGFLQPVEEVQKRSVELTTPTYTSPYGAATAATGPSGSSENGRNNLNQDAVANLKRTLGDSESPRLQLRNKILRLEGAVSKNDDGPNPNSRVSLGGETVVEDEDDDEFPQLNGTMDWADMHIDIKDPSQIFVNPVQGSDPADVAVR